MEPKSSKKKIIPAATGIIIVLCLIICVFALIIRQIGASSPSYKATQTARANARGTETAQVYEMQTENARPTDTLAPTELPTETYTITETYTLDPSITPPTPTKTGTPTATGTRTATPTKTPTATRTFTQPPTLTPIPETAGVTEWLTNDGQMLGVQKISFDKYIGYFVPETGKIFVSLYVVGLNTSNTEVTFSSSSFELIDGGGEVTSGVLFGRDPSFNSCTIRPGGKCEGWWTTEIWDRPEVKASLTFRWNPCLLLCGPFETPINQE
jgi:hypothetical protein